MCFQPCSNCTTSEWPYIAAQLKTVVPFASFESTSACAANSNRTTSERPFWADQLKGVLPCSSFESTSACALNSNRTTSEWPFWADQLKGVQQPWSKLSCHTNLLNLHLHVCHEWQRASRAPSPEPRASRAPSPEDRGPSGVDKIFTQRVDFL